MVKCVWTQSLRFFSNAMRDQESAWLMESAATRFDLTSNGHRRLQPLDPSRRPS